MMKVTPCYYGLNPGCTKGLGPDGKVYASCIPNAVCHLLCATYSPSNDTGLKEIFDGYFSIR